MAEDWDRLRKTLDVESFVARFPHPFLIVGIADEDEDVMYKTSLLNAEADKTGPEAGPAEELIVPLVKTAANPFQDHIMVGRSRNCDVVLRYPSVSKLHARIRIVSASEAEITEAGSTNGTEVNGRQLEPNETVKVVSGDSVHFGQLATMFVDAEHVYFM